MTSDRRSANRHTDHRDDRQTAATDRSATDRSAGSSADIAAGLSDPGRGPAAVPDVPGVPAASGADTSAVDRAAAHLAASWPTDPPAGGTAGHPGELLSALLDHELDPDTSRSVGRHVSACTTCAAELDGLGQARDALRGHAVVAAPAGFIDRLIQERHRADRRGVALASVAAGLVVVAGLAAAEPLDPPAPAEPEAVHDDGIVRLESRPVDEEGDEGRSLGDRAYSAAADLLDFLSG
jgi:hypothetical protein